MAAIRWATAVTMLLACAAAQAAGDKDSPKPVATSQPGKVFCKLIIGTAHDGDASVGSEPWIVKATTEDGCPVATDCSGWLELSDHAQQIDAGDLVGLSYQGACNRDAASNLLVIDLSGSRKKSLVLLNQVGQRDACELDRLPDGRVVFVAVEVVGLAAARPPSPWGEAVNNMKMHLKIDPAEWSAAAKASIQFLGVFKNVSMGGGQTPMWAAHAATPLEITGPDGKVVAPSAQTNPVNQPMFGGPRMVAGGRTASASIGGEWADSTLTIVSGSSATTWKWKLPPGQYQVRALTDIQDYPYGGVRPPGNKGCTSQPVPVTVAAPNATSKPDGK